MFKLCPECYTINNTHICRACGFPLDNKKRGAQNEDFFFDCIELINIGELDTAKKTIIEKLKNTNDNELSLLLEKINEINSLESEAQMQSKLAFDSYLSSNHVVALEKINNAISINPLQEFFELKSLIESELQKLNRQKESEKAFFSAITLIEKNDFKSGIEILNTISTEFPDNLIYKNELINARKKYATHSLPVIDDLINKKDLASAEFYIEEIKNYVSNSEDVNQLYNIEQRIIKAKKESDKRKNIFKSLRILSVIVFIGLLFIFFLQYKNDKDQWMSVQKNESILNYKKFISENSNSYFIDDANKALKDLLNKDDELWNGATNPMSNSKIREYIETMSKTGGTHIDEANIKLDSLDWLDAKKSNNINQFKNYIELHPIGAHVREANEAISMGVDDSEKATIKNRLSQYYSYVSEDNLESVLSNYENIIQNYEGRSNLLKEDLRNILTSNLNPNQTKIFNVNYNTLTYKKSGNGYINIGFKLDITEKSVNYDLGYPEETQTLTNLKIDMTFNTSWKIITFNSSIINPINN
jgi:hypothetical protein